MNCENIQLITDLMVGVIFLLSLCYMFYITEKIQDHNKKILKERKQTKTIEDK